jgi:beta-lactamase superfamily II metal-dependent hydrolase
MTPEQETTVARLEKQGYKYFTTTQKGNVAMHPKKKDGSKPILIVDKDGGTD